MRAWSPQSSRSNRRLLCRLDLAPQICRLRFDVLFDGDRRQVCDIFLDVLPPDILTITSLDSFTFFDPLVLFVSCTLRRGLVVFGDLRAQTSMSGANGNSVRLEERGGIGNGAMGACIVLHLEAVSHQYKPPTWQTIAAASQAEYLAQCSVIGL